MAFAQFYYDPAVEFEKLLDEHAYTTSSAPSQDSDVPLPHEEATLGGGVTAGLKEQPGTAAPYVLFCSFAAKRMNDVVLKPLPDRPFLHPRSIQWMDLYQRARERSHTGSRG